MTVSSVFIVRNTCKWRRRRWDHPLLQKHTHIHAHAHEISKSYPPQIALVQNQLELCHFIKCVGLSSIGRGLFASLMTLFAVSTVSKPTHFQSNAFRYDICIVSITLLSVQSYGNTNFSSLRHFFILLTRWVPHMYLQYLFTNIQCLFSVSALRYICNWSIYFGSKSHKMH